MSLLWQLLAFQPFLRFYIVMDEEGNTAKLVGEFQPFLRFYWRTDRLFMHYNATEVFQPFLRFYGATIALPLAESAVFQPFLRFYHMRVRRYTSTSMQAVSTLLEILPKTLRCGSSKSTARLVSTLLEILQDRTAVWRAAWRLNVSTLLEILPWEP